MKFRLLVTLVASTLVTSPVTASEYDDFRIPDHHWRSHSFALEGRLNGNDFGTENTETSTGSATGQASLALQWARDSEARQHRFGVSLLALGQSYTQSWSTFDDRSRLGIDTWYRTENGERAQEDVRGYATLAAEWREYPSSRPWGVVLAVAGQAMVGQLWSNYTDVTYDVIDGLERHRHGTEDAEVWSCDYLVAGELRFGLGRVRDATGVEQARLVLNRLRTDRLLERDPTGPAFRSLAALFYTEPAFGAPHDFPSRFFWREAERILREDGALGEGVLDAFGALHALEPLAVAGGRYARPAGWFAGPLITFQYRQAIERLDLRLHFRDWESDTLASDVSYSRARRTEQSQDDALAGAYLEWHRPLTERTQLDLTSVARADVDGVDVYGEWFTTASASYLVDERWYGWIGGGHVRRIAHQETASDLWQVYGVAGVRYYLEDRWNIGLEYGLTQGEQAINNRPHGDFSRDQSLVLRVGWDGGVLEAPGLFDPVRPLH